MKQKIVIIVGCPNCGKTTTLREVIAQLIADYRPETIECINSKSEFWTKPTHMGNPMDGWVKLKIQTANGPLTVGIATDGDSPEAVKEHLNKIKDCDIVFCAMRQQSELARSYIQNEIAAGKLVLPFFKPVYPAEGNNAQEVAKIVIKWAGL